MFKERRLERQRKRFARHHPMLMATRLGLNDEWEFIGWVQPPEEGSTTKWHPALTGMFHHIGPRSFPAGVLMPKGYDIEGRPGDAEGWMILRARCLATGQVMTQWAVGPVEDGVDLMESAK